MISTPYRSTPVFDEVSLPQALRRDHSTKAGIWGIIRVLDGELELHFPDGRKDVLRPGTPGHVRPREVHWVNPVGQMKMQVDFYDEQPTPTKS